MAISTEENIHGDEERYRWHYVYVQNLPWTACQSELLTFFKDLFIEEGCILIHGSEAFVAFKDSLTATKAMLKSGSLLHGTLIDISLVDKKFMSKILFRNVCRTLKFDDQIVSRKQKKLRHKIRPTRINGARPTNSCSFLPDEINYTQSMSKQTESLSYSSIEIKHSNNIKKKIHPTNVDDAYNSRFPVFHPEYCYEAKRIRLASSASLDI